MKLKRFTAIATATALFALPVFADREKEEFVRVNGQEVLNALNDTSLTSEQRSSQFGEFMDEFADLDAVARFTLGKYARRFSEQELAEYTAAFKRYAIVNYEVELDKYRGNEIEIVGSRDRSEDDSIVETVIEREDGRDLKVLWRVMNRDGQLQVMDVALNIEGNLIWLGIELKAQMIEVLDRYNGSAQAAVDALEDRRQRLESQKRADTDATDDTRRNG